MEKVINIEYPESLALVLKLSDEDFRKELKASSIVKLFELGKISSGIAAKVLGISRVEFLECLSEYKVSLFSYSNIDELNQDSLNA